MFNSSQKGKFQIKFSNGVGVSVIWGAGSYSDNHDAFMKDGQLDQTKLMGTDLEPCESTTAEVMITVDPSGKAVRFIEAHHGQNPAGYLTPEQVIDILTYARLVN